MIDGKKVKKIRKQLNLSQAKLAKRAGISQTQLSRIESGEGDTTTSIAYAVAKALNFELSELLVSENPTRPRPATTRRTQPRAGRILNPALNRNLTSASSSPSLITM